MSGRTAKPGAIGFSVELDIVFEPSAAPQPILFNCLTEARGLIHVFSNLSQGAITDPTVRDFVAM